MNALADSPCFRWAQKIMYDSIETSDAWLAFNLGMIKSSDTKHPSEAHPTVQHVEKQDGSFLVSVGGTLVQDNNTKSKGYIDDDASDALWQNSVRDNSTVHSDSRIRIDVESGTNKKTRRRRRIDFTTGGKYVKISRDQPRARLTKEALATTGESRDLHGYKVDDMAVIEPDMDQYDYDDYDDYDQIQMWGAPYSRINDNQSSSQQLLPHNNQSGGERISKNV